MRYFTPGPTQLHPRIPELISEALQREIGSISHRSKEFERIYLRATNGLRVLLELPDTHQIFFLASANEGWERSIQSCAQTHTFHLVQGVFAERYLGISKELGKLPQSFTVPAGEQVDLSMLNVPNESELICMVQNETSTGVAIPGAAIAALKRRYPDKLIALDVVSSAPIAPLPWSEVDCAFFSVQKCFGLPAGLAVMVVSAAARAKAHALQTQGVSVGSYHSLPALEYFGQRNQTPETPNVLGIFLLGGVVEDFIKVGLPSLRQEILHRADKLYTFFEKRDGFNPFVRTPEARSSTVLTIEVVGGSAPVIKRLQEKGYEVGAGYGVFKDSQIRIGNFPLHTQSEFEGLLRAFD